MHTEMRKERFSRSVSKENEVQHRAERQQGKGGNENEKATEMGRKEMTKEAA